MNNTAVRTARALSLALALTFGATLTACTTESESQTDWEGAQATLEKAYAFVQTLDARVGTAHALLVEDRENVTLRAEYDLRQVECVMAADQYDKSAGLLPEEPFKDSAVPLTIDRTAPETDCKE